MAIALHNLLQNKTRLALSVVGVALYVMLYEMRRRGTIFASWVNNFMVEIALRLLFRQSLSAAQ